MGLVDPYGHTHRGNGNGGGGGYPPSDEDSDDLVPLIRNISRDVRHATAMASRAAESADAANMGVREVKRDLHWLIYAAVSGIGMCVLAIVCTAVLVMAFK